MTRIAVGGFLHETNTFAPTKATYDAFIHGGGFPRLEVGDNVLKNVRGINVGLAGFIAQAESEGWELVPTIFAARQFVNHGHIKVNGKRVNIGSYRCKAGDVIEVREKSKQLVLVLESVQLAERDVPDYIEADHNKMTATFARVPGLADVPFPVQMEPNLVVEFYSR